LFGPNLAQNLQKIVCRWVCFIIWKRDDTAKCFGP